VVKDAENMAPIERRETRKAYADCMLALDAVFAKWGTPCK